MVSLFLKPTALSPVVKKEVHRGGQVVTDPTLAENITDYSSQHQPLTTYMIAYAPMRSAMATAYYIQGDFKPPSRIWAFSLSIALCFATFKIDKREI